MPYIPEWRREDFTLYGTPESPGELNYVITTIIKAYLGDSPNYADINEVVGVLECAKQEFYSRIARPYEDRKIAENGDVY